nr:transporter [Rhodococcus sp. X156]
MLLTLLTIAVLVLAVWAMYRGWTRRAQRQAEGLRGWPAPPAEVGPALLGPTTGFYIGTTMAGNWQDRVTVGDIGHRATAELSLHEAGVLLARQGCSDLWVPRNALVEVRTDNKLAGKVMTRDGLLVLRWRVASEEVDSGFRADDKTTYPEWLHALAHEASSGSDQDKNGDIA